MLESRRTWRIAAALLALATVGASPVASDPSPEALARLDGFALGLAEADRFAGVVLVARDGRILFKRAYGARDADGAAPAAADTRYDLASAGKMFTAVAILQQVAAGRLTLDTTVGAVLRDYRNRDFADRATVRQLLTHSGGAGGIELFGAENAGNRARARTVAEMVALHDDRPPLFPPGARQDYDNFGFVVLGRMVEVVSGEPFEAYLQRHVFGPAGMTRTGFVDCAARGPDIAAGTVLIEGERRSNCATQPARGFPAGGQVSTAGDMHRFVRALREGRLIPPALFEEATRTHLGFMGLGFFATDYGPDIPARDFRWGHGGSSDGACTDVRTYPATGETIIVLANRDPPGCFAIAGFLHRQWSARSGEAR